MDEKENDRPGRIRLHEERLNVTRDRNAVETVPVRVVVESATVSVEFAITYEAVDVSTCDVTHEHRIGEPIVAPAVLKVVLSRERIVARKATITTESVEVGRVARVEHHEAHSTLRREELDVVVREPDGGLQ